jgi:hypothetical protein
MNNNEDKDEDHQDKDDEDEGCLVCDKPGSIYQGPWWHQDHAPHLYRPLDHLDGWTLCIKHKCQKTGK